MKPKWLVYTLFIIIITICLIGTGRQADVFAYYGSPYSYTWSSLFNPMYSYGYGSSLFNKLSNPFGFGGIYNLTTSLYGLGGLMGGLYGLSGMYGLGGLYGLSGMYGLGGLYGLGSLYGLGGMYGLGSLCGLGGLYGLNSPCFLGLSSLFSGLTADPLATNNPLVAEQAGTWIGQWNLGFLFGTMVMNLKEDPFTGALSGTAQLIGNNTFSGIFNVYGEGSPTFVLLTGQDPTISYAITISAPLPTPTTMEGWYDIYKLPNVTAQESGTFALELVSATVI